MVVKVRGQISLYFGGTIVFGLSEYPVSEFELIAEELLMSDSIIKVCYFGRLFVPLFWSVNNNFIKIGITMYIECIQEQHLCMRV